MDTTHHHEPRRRYLTLPYLTLPTLPTYPLWISAIPITNRNNTLFDKRLSHNILAPPSRLRTYQPNLIAATFYLPTCFQSPHRNRVYKKIERKKKDLPTYLPTYQKRQSATYSLGSGQGGAPPPPPPFLSRTALAAAGLLSTHRMLVQ